MRKTVVLLFFLMQISFSQWRVQWNPSEHLFVSQGATKTNSDWTGTLGLHYYFTGYFGVSFQTNFINEFGWYQDIAVPFDDFKFNVSAGYSPIRNSISWSARINYMLRRFNY